MTQEPTGAPVQPEAEQADACSTPRRRGADAAAPGHGFGDAAAEMANETEVEEREVERRPRAARAATWPS